jgi:hypothetical protein
VRGHVDAVGDLDRADLDRLVQPVDHQRVMIDLGSV